LQDRASNRKLVYSSISLIECSFVCQWKKC
jgi:hypothetical protein